MDQQLAHCLLLVSVISSASFNRVTSSPEATDDSPSIQRLDFDDERDLLETGSDVRVDDSEDELRRLITSSIPHRDPRLQIGEGEDWKRTNEKSQSDSAPAAGSGGGGVGNRGKPLLGRSWLTSRRTQSGEGAALSSSSSSEAGGGTDNQYNVGRQFKLGKKSRDVDQMTANKRKTIKFG